MCCFSTSAWSLWCPLNGLQFSARQKSIFSQRQPGKLFSQPNTLWTTADRRSTRVLSCVLVASVLNRGSLKRHFKHSNAQLNRRLSLGGPMWSSDLYPGLAGCSLDIPEYSQRELSTAPQMFNHTFSIVTPCPVTEPMWRSFPSR